MGFKAGLVAFLAFGLSYHDPYSPRFTWFFLLVPIALLRFIVEGTIKRLLNGWKWAALILLLICFVPFAVRQIQFALYPQLEVSSASYGQRGMLWDLARSSQSMNMPQSESIEFGYSGGLARGKVAEQRQLSRVSNLSQSTDAKVQTGFAVPQWAGNQVNCYWSGPVTSNQRLTPVLLSCQMHRLLTVIKLALLFVLAAVLLGVTKLRLPAFRRSSVSAAMLLVVFFSTSVSRAQIPDPEMLETLRERLSEPSNAFPNAAEIAKVDLKLAGDRLTMSAEIHAAVAVAVPLPGRLPSWSPLSITLDGKSTALVCRRPDGYLWVSVPQGVHEVVVEGLLAETSEWEWTFVLPPRQMTIDANGWNVTGLNPDGGPGKQLFFAKQERRTDGEATYDQKNFRAVATVERRVEAGLIWKASTTVRRLSAPGKAISLRAYPRTEPAAMCFRRVG